MNHWSVRLARYALPQWRGLSLIAALTLTNIGVKLLSPWPLKLIVDNVVAEKALPASAQWISRLPGAGTAEGLLGWLAAATIVLFIGRRALKITSGYVEAGTSSRMVYRLATDLFEHLQNRSLIFHGRHRVGDLVKRVTSDCSCVKDLVMQAYLPLATSVVTMGAMLVIMWQLSPALTLFALALAVPLGLTTKRLAGPMSQRAYEEQELQGELMAHAEQTLSAVPVIQAFGREATEDARFRGLANRGMQATLHTLLSQQQFNVSINTLTHFATVVVMVVGGFSVLQGALTIGSLLVLLSYFNSLYSPIETLAYLGAGFASARAGARRVLGIMENEENTVREAPHARPLPRPGDRPRGHIRLQDVTFGYRPGCPVLQNVSLEACPGETVALVGATGAGKSTLVSLIARLYDPWSGTVYYDDVDVRDAQLRSLRENISIVMQEPFLFRMSVAENIAYGRPDASREEIIESARVANAHDFIQALPRGYDTIIGERGATLSGGQKQRLSIARALLKNSPVLILDEPTSSLDSQTESALIEAMERLMRGRTTFIIAHRLSTVRKASRIVVLDRGRVVEMGSHRELQNANGSYANFAQLQSMS